MINKKMLVKPIILGRIGSCYGVRGWTKLFSFTENAESILDYQPWFIQKADQCHNIELENWCCRGQNIFIKLKGINDRGTVSLLTNCKIVIDSAQLPVLGEDNYYWKDLIGCKIVATNGRNLGKVIDIIETGSNDVLVVEDSLSDDTFDIKTRLVPFLSKEVIKEVNLSTRTIEVNWSYNF